MLYTHHCDELTPIVLVLFNDPYMIDVVGHRLQFEMIALDPLVIECVMMGVLRKGLNPMDLFTMDEIFDSLALPPSMYLCLLLVYFNKGVEGALQRGAKLQRPQFRGQLLSLRCLIMA